MSFDLFPAPQEISQQLRKYNCKLSGTDLPRNSADSSVGSNNNIPLVFLEPHYCNKEPSISMIQMDFIYFRVISTHPVTFQGPLPSIMILRDLGKRGT